MQRDEEFVMGSEDLYPHYDFNFPKIREHWKQKLGSGEEAEEYLRVVDKRLGYWLQECGTWIDFEFALKHVGEDMDLRDAESHLTWLALRRRVRLANEQRKRLSPSHPRQDVAELGIPIKISQDGSHDAVWHEDFRNIYLKALARERKELKKLRETGFVPARKDSVPREGSRTKQSGPAVRPRIQWIWANRLLAYLFETLLEKEAICADDGVWAALDGVFADRHGEPITRKDLALWAHQYHNNKTSAEETGKPKKHQAIDEILEEIQG